MTSFADGIVLLGAEMNTWSDVRSPQGALRGVVAGLLLEESALPSGRALVVGPHDARLIEEIHRSVGPTDLLMRSLPDARELREVLPPEVRIVCGSLDRWEGEEYDVVVALDGLARVPSAESEEPPWTVTLDRLLGCLAGGGRLLLGAGNEVGLDRLAAAPFGGTQADADWPAAQAHVVPALDELLGAVADDPRVGLDDDWACYGPRAEPLLAVPVDVLTDRAADPRLAALVGRSCLSGEGSAHAATHPYFLSRVLVRRGLGAELAPSRVLLVRRGGHPAPPRGTALLVGESPAGPGSRAVGLRIAIEGEAWVRHIARHDPAPQPLGEAPDEAALTREPDRLVGPLPVGDPAAVALATCLAAHDIPGAGDLVRRYRAWLVSASTDGLVEESTVPLTFDGLVLSDGGLAPFDGSWRWSRPVPVDDVLVRVLLDAVRFVVARGVRHPWPGAADLHPIVRELVASSGIELDDDLWRRATELDSALISSGPISSGPISFGIPDSASLRQTSLTAVPETYAAVAELASQQQVRLAEMEAQLEWLVRSIHFRQRAVRFARGRNERLLNSPEWRTGRRVLWARALAAGARERLRARFGKNDHAEGEWRPQPEDDVREELPVDPDLLPPGYTPSSDTV